MSRAARSAILGNFILWGVWLGILKRADTGLAGLSFVMFLLFSLASLPLLIFNWRKK